MVLVDDLAWWQRDQLEGVGRQHVRVGQRRCDLLEGACRGRAQVVVVDDIAWWRRDQLKGDGHQHIQVVVADDIACRCSSC